MSLPDEDRPPPRDPLEDPEFAELVDGPPKEDLPAAEFAEPVEDLPVAQVIRPSAAPPPIPTKIAPNITMPTPVETEPPRPQWIAACSVIGCIGVLFLAAVAALIYIAITLLSNIGDKIADTRPSEKGAAKATVARGPIQPTVLAGDIELPLDSRVDAVCRGADGRFLLLRMPRTKEIHLFDANQAAIVHRFPIREDGALFAAGSEKLFVVEPLAGKIVRHDLFTGEQEVEKDLPKSFAKVRGVAIGAASSGPLYLATPAANGSLKLFAFDTGNLTSLRSHSVAITLEPAGPIAIRASDNGMVLGVSHRDGSSAVFMGGGSASVKTLKPDRGENPAWATPAPDGQFFYTPRGVFDTGGSPFLGTTSGLYSFPANHGAEWFLSLDEADDLVSGVPRRHPAGVKSFAKATDLTNAVLTGSFPANELRADELTAADRVHWWPAAGLAAVLPRTPANQPAKLLLYKQPIPAKP